jgi:hypothetical protein
MYVWHYCFQNVPEQRPGSETNNHRGAALAALSPGYTRKKKLRGFGPLAKYADRATAASWRSSTNFCG